jgi:hypothetical protein
MESTINIFLTSRTIHAKTKSQVIELFLYTTLQVIELFLYTTFQVIELFL